MTTTAQAVPALEVSAPDDNMDVLSDAGFDFGDGDIDIDLDTAPSVQDDDMSLNDAATDGGIDMDEPSADQDDFMADHGDLIEEDDVYNDSGAAVASETLEDSVPTFETDMLAPPDEDLIDYSDDEGQQQAKAQSHSGHGAEESQEESHSVEASFAPVGDQIQADQAQDDVERVEPAEDVPRQTPTHEDDGPEAVERNKGSPELQATHAELQREDEDDDNEDLVHADDGGIRLPTEEQSHSGDDDGAHNDTAAEQQADPQRDAGEDSENDHQLDQQIELRPVTVNYAGNELWLFKQHDLDDSGDFLLENLSVAKSSISDLFQACRLSLGDDVSGEHEIGFRFDHLHNLELYEDNTACVAVSLERLVDLYHTLQAQDGNEDPECFYVTLQFRPRFATLLADVAQYAEQGSGYSGLDAAVAAGETHFSNVYSSASTEHEPVEWDEENDDEDVSSPDSVHSIGSDGAEAVEHGEQHTGEAETQEDEQGEEEQEEEEGIQEHHHGVDLNEVWNQTLDTQVDQSVQETANFGSPHSTAPQASTEHLDVAHATESTTTERTPDQIAHDKQVADDFVDYSDDEDDVEETKSVPAHEPSPSSSTVQGDDAAEIQEAGIVPEHDGQSDVDTAGADLSEHVDDATLLTQTQYGDDANHYAFQDYAETYEQGDPFQDYQADGTEADRFDADGAYNNDTNQDFADYNFQDLEAEVNLGFDEQPLDEPDRNDQGNEAFEAVDDVTHADAFLDLDNAPEWAVDADPAPNLPGEDAILLHDDTATHGDGEGGAVEQPVAITSSAAAPALTSSNDHGALSPQGQKRSIDEVGDGNGDAPDSTGMATCLVRKRYSDTDICSPDAKRLRV